MRRDKINVKSKFVRLNNNILAPTVRVVKDDQSLGIMSIDEAKKMAFQEELDLVETVPSAKPPVCRIVDFKKYQYEQKKRVKEQQTKNKSLQSKEIRLRYCTGDHDLETKIRSLKHFLSERRSVRLVVRFKNREVAYKNQGVEVLNKMVDAVQDIGVLQFGPKLEGKSLVVQVSPKLSLPID